VPSARPARVPAAVDRREDRPLVELRRDLPHLLHHARAQLGMLGLLQERRVLLAHQGIRRQMRAQMARHEGLRPEVGDRDRRPIVLGRLARRDQPALDRATQPASLQHRLDREAPLDLVGHGMQTST
jgi:hypothetical protein